MFLFFLMAGQVQARAELFIIEKVLNGNTIQLSDGQRVRLIGVHVPDTRLNDDVREESKRTGLDVKTVLDKGNEISDWVDDLFRGKEVFLQYDAVQEDKKTGEKLAYVFVTDEIKLYEGDTHRERLYDALLNWWQGPRKGKFVFMNATIIKAGYADPQTDSSNKKYARLFEELYNEARQSERGLWDRPSPEDFCIGEGKNIGVCVGCWTECCKGLMAMYDLKIGGECREEPTPMAGGICSPCGNDVCERQYSEDDCNCPEDCKN